MILAQVAEAAGSDAGMNMDVVGFRFSALFIVAIVGVLLFALIPWMIYVIARNVSGAWIVAGLCLFGVLGIFVVAGSLVSYRQVSVSNDLHESARRDMSRAMSDAVAAQVKQSQQDAKVVVWDTQPELQYDADRYSNAAIAVEALCETLRPVLNEAIQSSESDEISFLVKSSQSRHFRELVGENEKRFRECLRTAFEDAKVTNAGAESDATIVIDFGLGTSGTRKSTDRIAERYANLKATVHHAGNVRMREVSFDVKPWLASVQEFNHSQSGNYLAGFSGNLMPDAEEAHRDAINHVRTQLSKSGALNAQVNSALESDALEVDRFIQKLSTPDGDRFREAILLDFSADRLASALYYRAPVKVADEQPSQWRSRLAGFVGMVVVACLLGWMLIGLTHEKTRLVATCSVAGIAFFVLVVVMLNFA